MIRQINYRDNGRGEKEIGKFGNPLIAALTNLCAYEIGFGGHITNVSQTSVEVRTQVMGCKDRTVFEGTIEEMTLLVRAAVAAACVQAKHAKEIVENAAALHERLPPGVRGVALHVSNLAPFFLGYTPGIAAIFAAGDIEEGAVSADLLQGLEVKSVMLALAIALGDGQPSSESYTQGFVAALRVIQEARVNGLTGDDFPVIFEMAKNDGLEPSEVIKVIAA